MKDGRIIPTLQSLSEGQSQLFHLFATNIRYGERADINMSIRLRDITGLVIIDEIAAHLHPTLQHDVSPAAHKNVPQSPVHRIVPFSVISTWHGKGVWSKWT